MKYRYAALFAAAASAAPVAQNNLLDLSDIGLNGGGSSNVPRSQDGLVSNVGAGVVAAGDGDGTGVKNAKRSEDDLVSLGEGHPGYYYDGYDDGDLIDLLKRSQDGLVTDDIGAGVVAGGDGDGTGVKNAKRSEDDLVGLGDDYDYYGYDDGALLDILKRSQDGLVTDDIGAGVVAAGNGDGTGVKNAKRSEADIIDDANLGAFGDMVLDKRSQADIIDDASDETSGLVDELLDTSDLTDLVKNAKRSQASTVDAVGDETSALVDEIKKEADGLPEKIKNIIKNSKRSIDQTEDEDKDLIGHVGLAAKVLGYGNADGVKNAKRGLVTDDIGAGVVAAGNGDGTGVKNAKRTEEGLTGTVGAGVVAGGDGDATGVKNAKRFEVGDLNVGSTGVGGTDNGIPIVDPDL